MIRFSLFDDAAAQSEDQWFAFGDDPLETFTLHLAKTFFSVERENLGNAKTVLALDLGIELDKRQSEFFRRQTPKGGFACTAQSDQGESIVEHADPIETVCTAGNQRVQLRFKRIGDTP